MGQNPEYCGVAEAARLLDVSRSTVWRWIESGRLRAQRTGPRTTRIKRDAIAALNGRPDRATVHDDFEARTGIWEGYDVDKVRQAFEGVRGVLKGLDKERFLQEMHEARSQKSRARQG